MEPDFGLPRKLISSAGITQKQKEKIEAETTKSEKNKVLLNIILENGKHHEFIDALRDSGQIHVVNMIMGNGGNSVLN